MTTTEQFLIFIKNLKSPVIRLIPYENKRSINLETLCKDITNFSNLHEWVDSKNLTPFLKKNILLTLLSTNPPENIKNELLLLLI